MLVFFFFTIHFAVVLVIPTANISPGDWNNGAAIREGMNVQMSYFILKNLLRLEKKVEKTVGLLTFVAGELRWRKYAVLFNRLFV